MIRDASGDRVLGMGTVTRDISDAQRNAEERERLLASEQAARRQLEAAIAELRESEERFRLTIDEAPIGMALLALDGTFARVNRVLCEITGYAAEELTKLKFQDITHPDDLDTDVALSGQLGRGEIPRYQLEKRYIRKDGSVVDIMLSGSILRGPDNAPLYYIAQIEDISERKRVEGALRRSEAKFSGIVSIAAEAIISVDTNQRITVFNEGAEQIFGYSKQEMLGTFFECLLPERVPDEAQHIVRRLRDRRRNRPHDGRTARGLRPSENGGGVPGRGVDFQGRGRQRDVLFRRASRYHPSQERRGGAPACGGGERRGARHRGARPEKPARPDHHDGEHNEASSRQRTRPPGWKDAGVHPASDNAHEPAHRGSS